MRYIVIDTSSILFGLANGKDVFQAARDGQQGYTPLISKGVIGELEAIKARKGKFGKYAGAALVLISMSHIGASSDTSPVDDWIAKEAKENGYAVCTNDTALKRSLKKARIRVFSMTRSGSIR